MNTLDPEPELDPEPSPSKAVEATWEDREKTALTTINERMRTMALGSLVLIWGLFLGDASKNLHLNKGARVSLLAVAFGAVVVVLLDYFEQWATYLAAKQRIPGSTVRPYGFKYLEVSKGAFRMKHILGVTTLIVLTSILALLLLQTVANAQTKPSMRPYYGQWCGSDRQGRNYMFLIITSRTGQNVSSLEINREDPVSCSITLGNDHARLNCRNGMSLKATPGERGLDIFWTIESPIRRSGQQLLLHCETNR